MTDVKVTDGFVLSEYYKTIPKTTVRYGTDTRHVCTNLCSFWYHQPTFSFVCKHSALVHRCGTACKQAFISDKGEGRVCKFTGFVTGPAPEYYYVSLSKDSYTGSKYKNNTHNNAVRNRVTKPKSVYPDILSIVSHVLCNSQRFNLRARKIRTLRSATAANLTRMSNNASTMDAYGMVWQMVVEMGHSLNLAPDPASPEITAVAATISTYWTQLAPKLAKAATYKTLYPFVCTILLQLSTGFQVGDVVVIPKCKWVNAHTATRAQYGTFSPSVKCRAITAMWRDIKSILISDHKIPFREYIMTHSLTTS
jgi:hypothetical protein